MSLETWERIVNVIAGLAGIAIGWSVRHWRVRKLRVTVDLDQSSLPPKDDPKC
jgi:hypothetical protein